MKFGVREICDVVFKAKSSMLVGNKVFYKHEPVIYFDSLKTSTLEGAATTVYAQGGRGNARLMAWEGDRTVTFTMEDALISPVGFMILSGAGLVDATAKETLKVHKTETTDEIQVTLDEAGEHVTAVSIVLESRPYVKAFKSGHEDLIYVMKMIEGEIDSEPYIPDHDKVVPVKWEDGEDGEGSYVAIDAEDTTTIPDGYQIYLIGPNGDENARPERGEGFDELDAFLSVDAVLVDYYVEYEKGAQQIDITPDKFGGNFYVEASTLFRNTDGVDLPAEFVIPNCKVQSNFTFTMSSSGDPSEAMRLVA